nr:unnamed protein product [Digitaria exilis]
MGQKDSKPSYGHSYDYYGNTSSGYNSRYAGNTSSSYAGNTSSSYGARYMPSSENNVQQETHARLQRKYSRIGDDYRSLSQVTEALAQAGLESSNLIVGIDFTKSNEWTGPTSFAPIIETAVGIVDSTGGQYHVLLIIADGQVTRSVDTQSGQLSPQERDTIDAIVRASQFPLSIVLVGVGDGPWDMMHQFDDNIPARSFDNFQFVNFTEIMSKSIAADRKEAEFALSALMEIPEQYKATLDLQLLGYLLCSSRLAAVLGHIFATSVLYAMQTKRLDTFYLQLCPICMYKSKDLAYGCGHQVANIHVFADLLRVREEFGALPYMPAECNHKDQALLI